MLNKILSVSAWVSESESVNSSHKGQWRGALMFPLICAWVHGWVNNGEAGDLRRHCVHYDVTVMVMSTFRTSLCFVHDDVIQWKHNPRNWPFVREIHRSPVNYPHKGQWRGALMFSLICIWINDWVNNREAGDLRRYRAHSDVIVMCLRSAIHSQIARCRCKMANLTNQRNQRFANLPTSLEHS